MANRVTASEVTEIFNTDLSDSEIEAFITTANTIIGNTIENNISDSNTLTEIEKYLAAHFATLKDPRIQSRKFADSSVDYKDIPLGNNINSTVYGQTANTLSEGLLSNLGKTKMSVRRISAI